MRIISAMVLILISLLLTRQTLASSKRQNQRQAFWFKGTASCCFVLAGWLLMPLCHKPELAGLFLAALIFGLLGDQLLAGSAWFEKFSMVLFAAGILAFAVGHGLYMIAVLQQQMAVLPAALIYFIVAFAIALYLVPLKQIDAGPLQMAGLIYIAVVTLMGGVTFGYMLKAFSPGSVLMAVGGLAFVLSDILLCIYRFGKVRRWSTNCLSLYLYYGAQGCLALSLAWL